MKAVPMVGLRYKRMNQEEDYRWWPSVKFQAGVIVDFPIRLHTDRNSDMTRNIHSMSWLEMYNYGIMKASK